MSGQVPDDRLAELQSKGYYMNDHVGYSGVELQYEDVLRGTPGRKEVEVDATGREIQTLDSKPAQPGNSLILSLDMRLQEKTAEFLRDGMGASLNAAAIVMDVHTGEILAMVSLPNYDDNVFADISEEQWKALLEDPAKPLVDHCISENYAPGSIFKQITGTAALQEGVANAGTTITSLGSITVKNEYDPNIVYIFRDWSALGTMDFYGGVARSSDVYFYYLGGRLLRERRGAVPRAGGDSSWPSTRDGTVWARSRASTCPERQRGWCPTRRGRKRTGARSGLSATPTTSASGRATWQRRLSRCCW